MVEMVKQLAFNEEYRKKGVIFSCIILIIAFLCYIINFMNEIIVLFGSVGLTLLSWYLAIFINDILKFKEGWKAYFFKNEPKTEILSSNNSKVFTTQEKSVFVKEAYNKILSYIERRADNYNAQPFKPATIRIDKFKDDTEVRVSIFDVAGIERVGFFIFLGTSNDNMPDIGITYAPISRDKTQYDERYCVSCDEGNLLLLGGIRNKQSTQFTIESLSERIWNDLMML